MKITKYIKVIKKKNFSLVTYFCFVVIRIILVFLPEIGYIHPDEFFQTSEVITGEVFEVEATRTWEFNSTFPIRSYAIPCIYLKIPLLVFKVFSLIYKAYFGIDLRTTYTLLVLPRLIMCLISFLNDWSIYKVCKLYNLKYDVRLLALASSFVMLTFGIRTFSNSIEMALCSVLLYLVSECMITSNTIIYQKEVLVDRYEKAESLTDKVKYYKMIQSLPSHSLNKCALISTMCVVGVFNRPTFIAFGMPMVFFWMLRGMGSKSVSFLDFNLRMLVFILSAIPSIVFIIFIDSLYYGFLTSAELYILEIGLHNFVVTPLNFIRYNIDPENTASHGVHPKYLHVLVNIPFLFNILGVIAIFSFGNMFTKFCRKEYQNLPRAQTFVSLMNCAIFVPVILLSFINHQEARFLVPVLGPIIMLHAPKLTTGVDVTSFLTEYKSKYLNYLANHIKITISGKTILKIWYTLNIALTLFFGFLHQGGIYQLAEHFSRVHQIRATNTHIHLVTSHMYNIPQSLLVLPSTSILYVNPETKQKYRKSKKFFLYEYGGMDLDMLYKKVKLILDASLMKQATSKHKFQLYLAISSSKIDELNYVFYKNSNRSVVTYKQVKTFYSHFSGEALPNIYARHPCELNTDVSEIDSTCSIDEYYDNPDNSYSVNTALRRMSALVHQFGLTVYKIDVKKPKRYN